jgi:carboxypeptidase family protein
MRWSFVGSAVIAWAIFSASNAFACSCAGIRAPCQAYGEAAAVFVGTVINSRVIAANQSSDLFHRRVVRFVVDTPFRGVNAGEVEVTTGLGGGDCGFGFVETQQYLVYAYEYEGKLSTGICTRTRSISQAQEDLGYLRGLTRSKPGVVISGQVVRYRRNPQGKLDTLPMTGIAVTIEGQTREKTETDAKGQYRVEGLPPGEYVVKVSLPEGLSIREPEQKVNVADRGCAVVGFWLEPDGRLSGRVLNPQGLPVNKAEIFIYEADKERYQGFSDAAYSDQDGKYLFQRVPQGRYLLMIRFDGMTSQQRPFPLTYYPGVSERSQAAIITIGEGLRVEKYDLTVPPLPLEYDVEGIALWANGTPAANARVEYMGGDLVSYSVKVDEQGRFRFKAYEGLKLGISASLEPEKGKYLQSNRVNVVVGSGLQPISLVFPNS